jgi:hypothetical protein
MSNLLLGVVLGLCVSSSFANELLRCVDRHGEKFDSLAQELWDCAELGYLESRSSTKLHRFWPPTVLKFRPAWLGFQRRL